MTLVMAANPERAQVESVIRAIKRERKARDLTQQDMADLLRVHRVTYANWERGEHLPDAEFLIAVIPGMAKQIGVDPGAMLIDIDFDPAHVGPPKFPVPTTVPIPLWPAVPAGEWEMPDETTDWYEVEPRLAGKDRVAARIIGDSMYPLLQQGDVGVFSLTNAPAIGSVVLARNEKNEATVKQLIYNDSGYVLRPANAKYHETTSHSWEVLGYLVGIVRESGEDDLLIRYRRGGIRP